MRFSLWKALHQPVGPTDSQKCLMKIEDHLRQDGHRFWGFVIYRTTFENETEWAQAIDKIANAVLDRLDEAGRLDMYATFKLTIIDDRELDGATSHVIRNHFRAWRIDAERREQGLSEAETPPPPPSRYTWLRASQRYRYCVQIDQESLQSLLYGKWVLDSWVRLINVDWEPELDWTEELEQSYGDMDGDGYFRALDNLRLAGTVNLTWDVHEEIEGCTLEDVGFQRVWYEEAMLDVYCRLRQSSFWYESGYARPPDIY